MCACVSSYKYSNHVFILSTNPHRLEIELNSIHLRITRELFWIIVRKKYSKCTLWGSAFGSGSTITTMTEKVEDINETVHRLEERIEGLEKYLNVSIRPKKNQPSKQNSLQFLVSQCITCIVVFSTSALILFLLFTLLHFIMFSAAVFDLSIERYIKFSAFYICRFYRLFGYYNNFAFPEY